MVKPSPTGTLECAQELGLTAVISSGVESSLALTQQLSRLEQWLTLVVTPGLDTLVVNAGATGAALAGL